MGPREALAAIFPVLARTPGVRLAYLFGSVARDAAGPDSDVDVALDASEEVDLTALASALSQALGCEVDVVFLRNAGVPLLQEILRDGRLAYEGAAYADARFRAHTLSDLEVDGPWFARMQDAWLRRVAKDGVL